ncbi:MAG: LacI family transcriptional regulator [Hungatella sp.]|nr:LacI family transcriptional regulator [Hungatella sp.]
MTITEIAEIAGVSPATVSRVFNHSEMVSENTKQKVLKAIKEYDYIPNPSFGNLSLQRISNNIGLFVPDMDNPFFNSIVKGVTQIADKYRYNIVLFNTEELPDREHRFLQAVWELNLKGLIMIPISSNDEESEEHLHKLEEIGLPVVLVDRKIGNYLCDSVFTEDAADSLRAVEALIAAGHKKIATITGSLRSTPGEERLRGYEQAMARHQLKIPSGYVEEGNFKIRRGREAALRLLSLPDPPTAIFQPAILQRWELCKAWLRMDGLWEEIFLFWDLMK